MPIEHRIQFKTCLVVHKVLQLNKPTFKSEMEDDDFYEMFIALHVIYISVLSYSSWLTSFTLSPTRRALEQIHLTLN